MCVGAPRRLRALCAALAVTPAREGSGFVHVQTDAAALPSMDALLGRHVDLAAVRKIGEGTFGEAFRAGCEGPVWGFNPARVFKPCSVRPRGPRRALPRQPGRPAGGGGGRGRAAHARAPGRPAAATPPSMHLLCGASNGRDALRRAVHARMQCGGRRARRRVVLKIVPMEGNARVNGEPQKRAGEVAAEVAIALALSDLRHAGARPARHPGGSPPRCPAPSHTVRHASHDFEQHRPGQLQAEDGMPPL